MVEFDLKEDHDQRLKKGRGEQAQALGSMKSMW